MTTIQQHHQRDEEHIWLNASTMDTKTANRTITTMDNTRNHSPRRSLPDNQRPPGRTNDQRKVNWRRQSTAHQSTHASWMDKNTGGATNADPKADGPTPITLRNMIQTSLSTRKQTTRRSSFTDKPTWEKDCSLNMTSGLPKSELCHATQRTTLDKHCANCASSLGEDSTTSTHG